MSSQGSKPERRPGGERGDVAIVLAAAGAGRRFGTRKHLLELAGEPILWHSLRVFTSVEDVGEICVVTAADDVEEIEEIVRRSPTGGGIASLRVVAGGGRRQDSVLNGLRALGPGSEFVLVHDGARPLVRRRDIEQLIAALRDTGAAVLGHPAVDSVKESRDGRVLRNFPRDRIWLVQTPQGARVDVLRGAVERAAREGFTGTDEASFLERENVVVALVEGSRDNVKVTYPNDLALAEFLLARSREADDDSRELRDGGAPE